MEAFKSFLNPVLCLSRFFPGVHAAKSRIAFSSAFMTRPSDNSGSTSIPWFSRSSQHLPIPHDVAWNCFKWRCPAKDFHRPQASGFDQQVPKGKSEFHHPGKPRSSRSLRAREKASISREISLRLSSKQHFRQSDHLSRIEASSIKSNPTAKPYSKGAEESIEKKNESKVPSVKRFMDRRRMAIFSRITEAEISNPNFDSRASLAFGSFAASASFRRIASKNSPAAFRERCHNASGIGAKEHQIDETIGQLVSLSTARGSLDQFTQIHRLAGSHYTKPPIASSGE